MGLWNLAFLSYGALKGGHRYLFSTGQIFCQVISYHIVAMIVLKCFHILTHCCAAVLSINTLFYKTNNIFYSLENWIWDKTNNDSESTSKIKVRSVGKFWKCCLHQQLFAFKKFCTETRLLNISKTTNVTDFINTTY